MSTLDQWKYAVACGDTEHSFKEWRNRNFRESCAEGDPTALAEAEQEDDPSEEMVDALVALRKQCDELQLDFYELSDTAYEHYIAERAIEGKLPMTNNQ